MTKKNPLRCIKQNLHGERNEYFSNMSKAFASMCNVYATVMDANIGPQNRTFDAVNKGGIWFTREFPTLIKGYMENKVRQIDAISPDGVTRFQYWQSGQVTSPDHDGLVKRTVVDDMLAPADLDDMFDDVSCPRL